MNNQICNFWLSCHSPFTEYPLVISCQDNHSMDSMLTHVLLPSLETPSHFPAVTMVMMKDRPSVPKTLACSPTLSVKGFTSVNFMNTIVVSHHIMMLLNPVGQILGVQLEKRSLKPLDISVQMPEEALDEFPSCHSLLFPLLRSHRQDTLMDHSPRMSDLAMLITELETTPMYSLVWGRVHPLQVE